MNELDLRIIELKMANPCYTDAQIAKHFGISRQTVSRRRNSRSFKDEISRIKSENANSFNFLLVKALARLSKLIDDENPRIALSACNLICSSVFPIQESVKILPSDNIFDRMGF